jgi:hypothetical protein
MSGTNAGCMRIRIEAPPVSWLGESLAGRAAARPSHSGIESLGFAT